MNTHIEIKKRVIDGVDVFEFHGELDETNADKVFTGIYNAIGEFDNKRIVLNLVGLKYLNSKSIGYLADIYSNLESVDGKMCIAHCTEEVYDTLELVGITSIVPTVDTEEEALSNLG